MLPKKPLSCPLEHSTHTIPLSHSYYMKTHSKPYSKPKHFLYQTLVLLKQTPKIIKGAKNKNLVKVVILLMKVSSVVADR